MQTLAKDVVSESLPKFPQIHKRAVGSLHFITYKSVPFVLYSHTSVGVTYIRAYVPQLIPQHYFNWYVVGHTEPDPTVLDWVLTNTDSLHRHILATEALKNIWS